MTVENMDICMFPGSIRVVLIYEHFYLSRTLVGSRLLGGSKGITSHRVHSEESCSEIGAALEAQQLAVLGWHQTQQRELTSYLLDLFPIRYVTFIVGDVIWGYSLATSESIIRVQISLTVFRNDQLDVQSDNHHITHGKSAGQ